MDTEKVLFHAGDESPRWVDALASSKRILFRAQDLTNSAFPFFKQDWLAQLPQDLTPADPARMPSQESLLELFRRGECD